MTGSARALRRLAGFAVLSALAACVPPPAARPTAIPAASDVRELPERPPLAVVVREGDPRAAISVAVLTAGIDEAEGARVPVALGAVVLDRLEARGVRDVSVAPTWDGYRVRMLVPPEGGAAPLVQALREALLTPIPPLGREVLAAQKRLAALARRPLHDPALLAAARCGDEPYALPAAPEEPTTAAALESWRSRSHGLGRVVIASAGSTPVVEAVASALLHEAAWPVAAAVGSQALPAPEPASMRAYDASPELSAGGVRVSMVLHAADARTTIHAARALGAADGPLVTRLRGLENGIHATLRDVTATAGARGGCLSMSLAVSLPRTDDADSDARVATVVALARQEALESLASASTPATLPAFLAGDPREAAELAAWWTVVTPRGRAATSAPPALDTVAIGLGGLGDNPDRPLDVAGRSDALTAALRRAEEAWGKKAVESRVSVEPGQGAIWILVGSPCGTSSEGDADAGLSALSVVSLAEDAREHAGDMEVREWIASDGLGIIVRAAKRDGESARDLGRRAADLAGATLAAWTLDPGDIGRARASLLDRLGKDDAARGFGTLAAALHPGHPAWDLPLGNGAGLEAWPDSAVMSRVAALRKGPLRVAVLANDDATQGDAAVEAVDRWILRAPGERACSPSSPPTPARPGTYAAPSTAVHEAWLAFPLTPNDAGARDAARIVAAALDGADGLLARALASGLASSWGARIVGPATSPALVVRVGSSGKGLDPAVAEVRALFDRLRQGAFTEADRTRATTLLSEEALRAMLDPRERLIRLWRGESAALPVPPLDTLRGFLAQTFHDDALVIVAAHPAASKAP